MDSFRALSSEFNQGDRVLVNVTNQLTNATTVHWHGLYQNGTNWMDGTTGITQCPIPPGTSFLYNFTVRTNTARTGTTPISRLNILTYWLAHSLFILRTKLRYGRPMTMIRSSYSRTGIM